MGFTASELAKVRKNWDKLQGAYEPSDPNYTNKTEQRVLLSFLTLSEDDLEIALKSYRGSKKVKMRQAIAHLRETIQADSNNQGTDTDIPAL